MTYVKGLDGMRGVAVLLVTLLHYGYFGAGWVGVQCFFTLSGFLITSILLSSQEPSFASYLGRFVWRRSLRIFPLYFVFLVVVALLYQATGEPASFGSDWPYLFTYTANFAVLFADNRDLGPAFGHLWSLSLEEQFYLFWPAVVFFVPRKAFKWLVLAILVATPLLRALVFAQLTGEGFTPEDAGHAVYNLPFTQLDAFAAGAAIPTWGLERLRHAGRWFWGLLAITGAAGLGVLVHDHLYGPGAWLDCLGFAIFMPRHYQYVWGYTLLNTLFCVSIILVLQGAVITKPLENRVLVRVGQISYGIYVYHSPIRVALEHGAQDLGIELTARTGLMMFPVYLLIVYLVAEASFHVIEAPFLRMKEYWERRGEGDP